MLDRALVDGENAPAVVGRGNCLNMICYMLKNQDFALLWISTGISLHDMQVLIYDSIRTCGNSNTVCMTVGLCCNPADS